MTRRIASLALLACLVSGGHATVHADVKVYAASTCVKTSTTGTLVSIYGEIGNESATDALRVDCPVIHDAGAVQNGAILALNKSTSSLECSFVDMHMYPGDPGTYGVMETHSISQGSSRQWMTFGSFPNFSTSHRYYSCWIPAKAGLGTAGISYLSFYKLDEQ